MPGKMLSGILIISFILVLGLAGDSIYHDYYYSLGFAVTGFFFGLLLVRLLKFWLRQDLYKVIGGTLGALIGTILAFLFVLILFMATPKALPLYFASILILISLVLVGLQLGTVKAKDFKKKIESAAEYHKVVGILDTSVIIDGRIADVCETGFLDGDIIIPQFVLKELQMIADSSESTKRTRGRRGLDILNKIKKQPFVKIIIDDTDYPSIKEVDQKLLHMARETGYAILTNDFNLNKVAEVQSIQVLNINQLANSLKPIVLPGETMKVQVLKEGKESGQGIAYLDDGTMVVVDSGRRCIGKTIEVTVTSVLQTTAGRMIFAVTKV
jgi:uncharacterized protein YacL